MAFAGIAQWVQAPSTDLEVLNPPPTDGMYNAGIGPLEAAQWALDSGVRVYAIGYGTEARAMSDN